MQEALEKEQAKLKKQEEAQAKQAVLEQERAENRRAAQEFIGGVDKDEYEQTKAPPPTANGKKAPLAGSAGFDPVAVKPVA